MGIPLMTASTAFRRNVETSPEERLVEKHTPLVRRIAYHLITRLPPNVQVDDLIQAGMIGLLEASRNYSPDHGAKFETFAGIRIRGAMLDEIRKSDWTPRSMSRKLRQISEAIREIEAAESRDARDTEIAERLGTSLEEYHRILKDAWGHKVFSFEDLLSGGDFASDRMCDTMARGPLEDVQHDELRDLLAQGIAGLPEREQLVMALYYDEELNLREIGAVLNVSESRVCQIHGQAIVRLRTRMTECPSEERLAS
jgi:RNA polymerase sigma factor for flagellar operon FliA